MEDDEHADGDGTLNPGQDQEADGMGGHGDTGDQTLVDPVAEAPTDELDAALDAVDIPTQAELDEAADVTGSPDSFPAE